MIYNRNASVRLYMEAHNSTVSVPAGISYDIYKDKTQPAVDNIVYDTLGKCLSLFMCFYIKQHTVDPFAEIDGKDYVHVSGQQILFNDFLRVIIKGWVDYDKKDSCLLYLEKAFEMLQKFDPEKVTYETPELEKQVKDNIAAVKELGAKLYEEIITQKSYVYDCEYWEPYD